MHKKYTESEMQILAEELAHRVDVFPEGGNIFFLEGEVGSGKTTFTRFFSEYLREKTEIKPEIKTKKIIEKNKIYQTGGSPTFSLLEQREISEHITLFHGDFYRAEKSRIEEVLDEYQEIQEEILLQNPEHMCIWILEWFPREYIDEFFRDDAKIFLNFLHGETQENRHIEVSFQNPHSCSKKDVSYFIEQYKTPVHIQKHIEMVRKISVLVADKLLQNKIPIDRELVENAALLHDAVKYVDFSIFPGYPNISSEDFAAEKKRYDEDITPEKIQLWKKTKQKFFTTDHGKAMANILTTAPFSFSATARVIESHMTRRIFSPEPLSWEEKCVYYADKRALHDTFVTIKERLEDGKKRYPYESSHHLFEKIKALELSLENAGNFSANSLSQKKFIAG